MTDRCDQEVFKNGHAICILDACRHRAEAWVQAVSRLSGQRVDWHYSGGIANVLYLGDYAKVAAAVDQLAAGLQDPMPSRKGECGSCSFCGYPTEHRPGTILRRYAAEEHGVYRQGDPVPDGALGAVTSSGETEWI